MIIGKDVTVNIRFPVGRKYVIATITFKQGEDSEDILRIFLVKENIPIYLENSILATVHNFLQDDSFIKEEVDLLLDSEVMEKNMNELSNSLSRTTRQYYRDVSSTVLTLSNVKQALSKFDDKTLKFEREFHALVSQNAQSCELIIRANEYLQTAFQKLTSLRKVELEDLYSNIGINDDESQSDEMNKAMGLDQSNISNLVVKHVKELEELEVKYKEKIEALKKMQRIKYREYIAKISSSEKIEYSQFDPMEEDDSRVEKRWNRRWFKLRDEPLENSQSEIKVEEEKLGYESSIIVSIGNKTPIIYSIQLNTSPIPSLIRRSMKDKRLQVKAIKSIYGKSLNAYVMISEPNLSYQSKTTTEIVEINESSTEIHFTSLTDQLNHYKSQINPPSDMNSGDVFITKHSNMGDAHVLYHLFGIDTKKSPITENSLQCNFESPLFTGLKNIFEVSTQYDVSTITIPLLLMDTLPEHLFNHPACLGRSITVMRAVKSLLLDSTDDTLKTIRFILPPVSQDVFEKYKSALKNVFTYQL